MGTTDMVAFSRDEPWAGFDRESDEHDYEKLQESYENSIDRVLREVIGNCVPFRFGVHDLQAFMPAKEARIRKARYHYEGQGTSPREITVVNAEGEEKWLRLL